MRLSLSHIKCSRRLASFAEERKRGKQNSSGYDLVRLKMESEETAQLGLL